MVVEILSLIEVLKQIADNRKAKGKRYPLYVILTLIIIATICGYKTYSAIAEWGRNYTGEIIQKLGFTREKTPCAATVYNVIKTVDVELLELKLNEWFESFLKKLEEAIAIDGKTLRGTKQQGGVFSHLISVFSHRLGATLFQCSVDSKTNEIPVVEELLKNLILEGKIITIDALHTQRETAKTIIEEKGDYVMIVKDNQHELKEDIQCVLKGEEKFGDGVKISSTLEKGHGRIEYRKITISSSAFINWPGAKQVFKIEREIEKKKKTTFETVYGITSLIFSPEQILKLVRGHWGIENKSHWVRDVVFDEDRNQVKDSNIGQFMACFRNLAISLIRLFRSDNISESCRYFAANPLKALELISTA